LVCGLQKVASMRKNSPRWIDLSHLPCWHRRSVLQMIAPIVLGGLITALPVVGGPLVFMAVAPISSQLTRTAPRPAAGPSVPSAESNQARGQDTAGSPAVVQRNPIECCVGMVAAQCADDTRGLPEPPSPSSLTAR
jgi:hypothetical protein